MKFLYPVAALTLLLAACAEPSPSTPNAPSAVAAASSETAPSLTWQDKSNNEEGFVIYRDTLSMASSTAVTSLEKVAEVAANTTTFQDQTAIADARYVYYVAAKNALGESERVQQVGEAVRVRPAFEVAVGSATTTDWRFPGMLTAFLLLVNEDSAKPQSDVTVTVTGPTGWNGSRPYVFTSFLGEFGRDVVRVAPTIPLVSGTYQTSAVVNGQTYITESVVSSETVLGVSKVDFKLEGNAATSTWTNVADAKSYRSFLGASDINIRGQRTLGSSSQFTNLNLGPAEYTGRVYALNYDATAAKVERPFPQFVVSVSESDITLVPFTAGTFFKVNPAARYLERDGNDTGGPATALSLSQISVVPGECLALMRSGAFVSAPLSRDGSPDMIGVFSNGSSFLNPGALGNQSGEFTTPTPQGKTTDIAQDFLVPGRLITVQIPQGATQLLLAADDVRNSDDTDPDTDFGVLYAKVSCPSSALKMQSVEKHLLAE